jgi:Protein of unknown function (DUF993)
MRHIYKSQIKMLTHFGGIMGFETKTIRIAMNGITGRIFQMLGGLHSGRCVCHLSRTFELADQAGLLKDPALAAFRMSDYLRINGVGV